MILRSVVLKGMTRFAGEVAVDFDALGPGLVAFAGRVGAGKTTLLDACSAAFLYRECPTRDAKDLASAFPSGEGFLHVRFALDADEYLTEIEVRNGKISYARLLRNDRALTSGKVSDYDEAIQERFGPKAAFYASCYGLQGGRGKMAWLTPGERRELFRFYLQLDRLDRLSTRADAEIKRCGDVGEKLTAALSDRRWLATKIAEAEAEASEADRRALAAGAAYRQAKEHLEALESVRGPAEKRRGLEARLAAQLARAEVLAERLEALGVDDPSSPAASSDPARLQALREELQAASKRTSDLTLARHAERTARATASNYREAAGLIGQVPCRGEGLYAACPLLGRAVAAQGALPGAEVEVERAETIVLGLEAIACRSPDVIRAEAVKAETADRAARGAAERRIAAKASAEALRDEFERIAEEVAGLELQCAELPATPDSFGADWRDAENALTRAEAERSRTESAAAAARSVRDERRTTLDRLDVQIASLRTAAKDAEPYRLLAKATGPDGIQAMEVAAVAPEIAGLADELLSGSYGTRFSLRVSTLRERKSGQGGAIEECTLRVLDRRRPGGLECGLGDLSGGEQVVVDEALRTALGIVASRRLPHCLRTLYRDEVVGALSPQDVDAYLAMLRKTMEIADLHRIFLIAHNPDVVDACAAVVRIRDDGRIEAQCNG